MTSLTKKKRTWEIIKGVGEAMVKGCIGLGIASGGIAMWAGAAKAAVTIAALVGAGVPVVLGSAAFITGLIMVSSIEKEIERMTPHLSATDLKKLIPKEPEPAAPALTEAPDLGKEFAAGVDNVETMKPLRFKPGRQNNQTPTA